MCNLDQLVGYHVPLAGVMADLTSRKHKGRDFHAKRWYDHFVRDP